MSRSFLLDDEFKEITDVFDRNKKEAYEKGRASNKFTHFNHNNRDQLELLVEYVKDGRKVTGDNGLRIIIDGNDVEELGVNERLTFEL